MTYIFSSSVEPRTGGEAMWTLKNLLVSAGWSVVSSSDASRFGIGDILSTSTGLDANNSWFVVKQPLGATASYGGVRRELAFRRGTAGRSWMAQYSYSASFTGSATLTATPTALDRVRVLGGEDFTTFSTTHLPSTDGLYRIHAMADNASPYGFYMLGILNAGQGTAIGSIFAMDPLLTGTFPTGDNDPYVFFASSAPINYFDTTNTNFHAWTTASNVASPMCWYKKGLAGEGFRGVAGVSYVVYSGQHIVANGTTNTYTQGDVTLPVIYYRGASVAAPQGYKGVSSLVRWNTGPLKTLGDTISIASSASRDYICVYNAILPWDGTVPRI